MSTRNPSVDLTERKTSALVVVDVLGLYSAQVVQSAEQEINARNR
ncbi:hypothetical protein [Caballeronia sordidicola]|jgi:hypothetical protein|uniref:Uncharacterized protein n=1 Tax=Caballeronia sordidicola TaxID=196367 RepID=A0A226X1T8_CABSO|nr:hypothetical protein [Caballeronia sordidicola]OXC77384.1 hypothetical protein BSU04_17770 [Caballeronia sordidicola]